MRTFKEFLQEARARKDGRPWGDGPEPKKGAYTVHRRSDYDGTIGAPERARHTLTGVSTFTRRNAHKFKDRMNNGRNSGTFIVRTPDGKYEE